MDPYSNDARAIRAMVETLHDLARKYDETGQLNARDHINDAAESVGALASLPDPDENGEDVEAVDA